MAVMTTSPEDTAVIYLPAGSIDWAGVLTQFTMLLAANRGRQYANWAAERLLRATRTGEGVVALADGRLRGFLLFEVEDQVGELTLPWTPAPDHALTDRLALAAVQTIQENYPDTRHIRAERQLLAGEVEVTGLGQAGFVCHWRRRMALELHGWRDEAEVPGDYRVGRWQIILLDQAAEVVFRANEGTLDAVLYAQFFGDSPSQCRKGLLAILAGKYGPIHPAATLCAFRGNKLVGLNLVVDEGARLASVVEISVHPDHQRRGIGRLLMARCLQILKSENFERVELAVTHENFRALRLYESLGFSVFGDFPVCVLPETK